MTVEAWDSLAKRLTTEINAEPPTSDLRPMLEALRMGALAERDRAWVMAQ